MSAAEKLTEEQAARHLGISKASLTRARYRGEIYPIRHGPRIIRYTIEILDEYEEQCRNAPAKSETTGSVKGPARSSGAAPGMTPPLDRQSAHHLAQATFKRPS